MKTVFEQKIAFSAIMGSVLIVGSPEIIIFSVRKGVTPLGIKK